MTSDIQGLCADGEIIVFPVRWPLTTFSVYNAEVLLTFSACFEILNF